MRIILIQGLLTSAAVCFAAPAFSQTSSTGRQGSESKGTLEEIVVTAQKREEVLKDVPISISVLTGDELDTSTAEGVTEALKSVPGVAAFPHSQGGGTFVTIRGAAAAGPVLAGSSPVSYYLDSVPFGLVQSAFAPDANAYDLERVEVLRGPQGTLYGASAQAGVVRVLTKDANLEKFELKSRGSISDTEGGDLNYRADAAINVPIVENKFAARAVIGYEDLSGWIDTPFKENSNDAQLLNVRLKVNSQPTDELSIGAFAWFARDDYGGPSASDDEQRRNALIDESITIDYDTYGLKIAYEFPAFVVTSSTGYIEYSSGGNLDLNIISPTGSALPFFTGFEADVFSEELVLSSTGEGPWRWTVGGIYRDGQDTTHQVLEDFGIDLGWTNTSKSSAVFGEISRRFLNNKLEWTLGGRYFRDDVVSKENPTAPPANPPSYYRAEETFDATTPRVVLSWYPNDELTVYGSYSQGFRSGTPQPYYVTGGVPGAPPVKPDTLYNYEVGAKGNLWDSRFQFDTAVYYMYWKDIQQQLIIPFGPSSDTGVTAIVNGESASGMGVDFGLTVRPAERWTLGLNFSWNDLTMDEDILSGGAILFSKGERPNFSPETTAGASAEYAFPLGGGGLEGRLSASANYTSEQGFRFFTGGDPGFGDSMLIARASFSIQAKSGWGVMVFADNVNNEQGSVVGSPGSDPNSHLRVRPRTVGVQAEIGF